MERESRARARHQPNTAPNNDSDEQYVAQSKDTLPLIR
jgi:hypothetical protein